MLRNRLNDVNKAQNISTEGDIHDEKERVRVWLQRIGYLHYFQNFFKAGYDSIDFIKRNQQRIRVRGDWCCAVTSDWCVTCDWEIVRI